MERGFGMKYWFGADSFGQVFIGQNNYPPVVFIISSKGAREAAKWLNKYADWRDCKDGN